MLQLLDNRLDADTLASHLNGLLAKAERLFIHVAYLRVSGVILVREAVIEFIRRGGQLRLLAGGDFAQTEPDALDFFRQHGSDCQVRLISSSGVGGFHSKCYLAYDDESATLCVGSSNFTDGGLQNNVELNLRADLPCCDATIVAAQRIFDDLWDTTPPLTDEALAGYRQFWEQYHQAAGGFIFRLPPQPDQETETKMESFVDPGQLQAGDTVQFDGKQGTFINAKQVGERWSVMLSIEGEGTKTLLSPPTKFQRVETPLSRARSMNFDSPLQWELLTEATRLSLAFEHDRLVSLSNSRTKLEPYQVAAVHKVVAAWEQRFLIADDVGLGKTIETGMVIKELKARGLADKILIICPAGLVLQWQREMFGKFDEEFTPLSSADLRKWRSTRPAGEPLTKKYPHAIVSMEIAKPRPEENNAPDFTEAHWDVVIIDEAHKVARHGADEIIARHKLARDIAPACDALLLLSATPHNGDPSAFHSLVSLLDPLRFPTSEIVPRDLEPIMVRRGKADIRNEDGSPLFPPRWVQTTEVKFSRAEKRLYDEVTEYVREGYRAASDANNNAVGFVMVMLQKRMVSSIAAIRCSLERRLYALKHPETQVLTAAELRELREREEDAEAVTDERSEELSRKLETALLKGTKAEQQAEIKRVGELLKLAEDIALDSKAEELRKFVAGVLSKEPGEKILIFTEYKDTLDYLRDKVLTGFGTIAQIYGAMNMEERRVQEEEFQKPKVRLMLATDAAGEGLNLQFCHLMVNYELPWNPNRIEQRIGRLHRYGQKRDVRVYNLQVVNTREGIILARLLKKIETIEKQLGGYAPNVLGFTASGESISLNRLSDMIINALAADTPAEVTAQHIEQVLEKRREMAEQLEHDLFMPLRHFDKGATDRLIRRSQELTPSNTDIENFVRRYFEMYEGKIENTRHKDIVRLRPPHHLADGKSVLHEYPQVTFDKNMAFKYQTSEVQFVAFGHPLLKTIINDCRTRQPHLRGCSGIGCLPKTVLEAKGGILFNYTLRYSDAQDNTLGEELLPVWVTLDEQVDLNHARHLLQVAGTAKAAPHEKPQVADLVGMLEALEMLAQEAAAATAQRNYEALKTERERQAKALLKSLTNFQKAKKQRLEAMTADYQLRLDFGENMDIAMHNVRIQLERLDEDIARRQQEVEGRRYVQLNAPALLNLIVLVADK